MTRRERKTILLGTLECIHAAQRELDRLSLEPPTKRRVDAMEALVEAELAVNDAIEEVGRNST